MEEQMEEQSYQQPIQEEQVPQAQPEQVAPTQEQTNQPIS